MLGHWAKHRGGQKQKCAYKQNCSQQDESKRDGIGSQRADRIRGRFLNSQAAGDGDRSNDRDEATKEHH